MKSYVKNILCALTGIFLALAISAAVASAQTPSANSAVAKNSKVEKKSTNNKSSKEPSKKKSTADTTPTSATVGEDAGNYTIVSTFEVGVRGLRVVGDDNKYRSDLNYKAGARLFDSSFLAKSKDGKGPFDTFLVTSSGWGSDPTSNLRMDFENPKWYRFEGSYRRAKYFRYLNNIVNPNWAFTGFPVPPNPAGGLHNYNTRTEFGDFDLTILPKNEKIRFTVGYSPERYSGPFTSNYHIGGNEFQLFTDARSRANDYRIGADGKLGPIDWTFLQGFRRFRDDTSLSLVPRFINPDPTVARFTTYNRNEPTRGSVNFTRGSIHSLVAKKLDITGRIIYSRATANSTFIENLAGTNFNSRIGSGAAAQVKGLLLLGQYVIPSNVKRPNTVGDIGVTFLATDNFRVSNTFRVEDFTIDGVATFNDIFNTQRTNGTVDSRVFSNLMEFTTTHYRKYQDIIEGDYQFNPHYSVHFGYRYGRRRDEQTRTGFDLTSNGPGTLTPESGCIVTGITAHCVKDEIETNHTNAFFGGFKARPVKNWTLYFDAEHGTADNVFTRIGNYDYTNIRAKSRYTPNRKVAFNIALITKNNSNPSEIAGESLGDFGVNLRTRTIQSNVDWTVHNRLGLNIGYNYNWVNSDAVIDYFVNIPVTTWHHFGHSLYFQRNNFFFLDATARINRRVSFFASYRINEDGGQGNRVSGLTEGTPTTAMIPPGSSSAVNTVIGGRIVSSYPMSYQSPEARFAFRLNRMLDWNVGYQYFNYHENAIVGPRPQNYHAHQPYTSLRIYIGRKE